MKKAKMTYAAPMIKVMQLFHVNAVLTGSAAIGRLKEEDDYDSDSYVIDNNYDSYVL